MAKHRGIFREGGKKGISQDKADEVFDLMEKFAGYGFNKSHAAAYSLLAYHTLAQGALHGRVLLRQHDRGNGRHRQAQGAVRGRAQDGHQLRAAGVNRGVYRFEPVTDKVIRYGLGAIKGTGQQAIEAIIAAREGRAWGRTATSRARSPACSTSACAWTARASTSAPWKR
jgi:DNA polymerase-3 subunit alpha